MHDSDDVKSKQEESKKRQFLDNYLESTPAVRPGTLVKGTVLEVLDDKALVSVSGLKKEVEMPLDGNFAVPQVGDEVEALLHESATGKYSLLRRKERNEETEKSLKEACDSKTPVLGKFIKVKYGRPKQKEGADNSGKEKSGSDEPRPIGYLVELSDTYNAICWLPNADVERVADPESLIGVQDYFILEKFVPNPNRESTVNRRAYLESQIKQAKDEFFNAISVGDVVEGTVKSLTSFGAFINLGGFDGLLHLSDMSWGRVTKAKSVVKIGDVLRLRVVSFDKENYKINLSLKDMEENPWNTFMDRYEVGQVVKGTVMRVVNFGVFVEIEPGIEGLCHISELSWTKKNFNPAELYHAKDQVEVKILGYDIANKRISLTIKQLLENPWNSIVSKYPVGTKLTTTAVKVTDTAAFFKIVDDIDGFLSIDDISWTEKFKNMHDFVKEGETKEVTISQIDPKQQRIRLSVKDMSSNPWLLLSHSHPKNSSLKAIVTSVSDNGINVKVNDDISAFINKFNLNLADSSTRVSDAYSVGQEVEGTVIDINVRAQKLVLSLKEFERRQSMGDIQQYMSSSDDDDSAGFTLGDIFAKKDSDN